VKPGVGGATFTLRRSDHPDALVESPLAGRHNVWNTLAALGIGLELGHGLPGLIEGIQQFKGTKKRQEERGEANGVLVIDDYAHHPTAIRETLNALKARYDARRLWAVYEPKSNTARRNVHQAEYATAFGGADEVIIARPYQKEDRFGPDEALDVHRLVAEINANGTSACYQDGVQATLDHLLSAVQPGDVVAFMSGSGFGGIHDKLLTSLALR
jgi:UDP-N-acetylmuramate: L-alanyl-gamma-D-glutamyl-meso-diaminopimelate ligase